MFPMRQMVILHRKHTYTWTRWKKGVGCGAKESRGSTPNSAPIHHLHVRRNSTWRLRHSAAAADVARHSGYIYCSVDAGLSLVDLRQSVFCFGGGQGAQAACRRAAVSNGSGGAVLTCPRTCAWVSTSAAHEARLFAFARPSHKPNGQNKAG